MIVVAVLFLFTLIRVHCFNTNASFVPEVFLNRVDYSTIQVYLHHIPCAAYHDRTFDVSIWDIGQTSPDSVETRRLLATINDFMLEDTTQPSFCTCHMYINFAEGAHTFRAILRFGSSIESLKSIPPVSEAILPSLMDELRIYKANTADYYEIVTWLSPTIESASVKAKEYAGLLLDFLQQAEAGETQIQNVREGYSGKHFQVFLNLIGGIPDTRYLEVGVYNGSSLISILENNNALSAVAVDIWDPQSEEATKMKNEVITTVQNKYNQSGNVHILHDSCWNVTSGRVMNLLGGPVNVYFYDAGHSVSDHFLSVGQFFSAMDEVFIFIVDDWNWNIVQKGTLTAMELYPIKVVAKVEITTVVGKALRDLDLTGSWHNGMVAYVLQKTQ